jgi:outer membrane lipoprotein-sorting protein
MATFPNSLKVNVMILFILFHFSLSAWAQFLPTSFKANYEESYMSTTHQKIKKSTGVIHYQYPRHLKFEVLTPEPALFVTNPRSSWYYTPPFIEGEEGQVIIQKSDKLVLTKLLDVLKDGLTSNKVYSVNIQDQSADLSFQKEYKADFKMDKVVLTSSKKMKEVKSIIDLSSVILFYQNGQKVNLVFSQIEKNPSFPKDFFEFKIPEKTKVTQEN